jgi:hypothetical protein
MPTIVTKLEEIRREMVMLNFVTERKGRRTSLAK